MVLNSKLGARNSSVFPKNIYYLAQ